MPKETYRNLPLRSTPGEALMIARQTSQAGFVWHARSHISAQGQSIVIEVRLDLDVWGQVVEVPGESQNVRNLSSKVAISAGAELI